MQFQTSGTWEKQTWVVLRDVKSKSGVGYERKLVCVSLVSTMKWQVSLSSTVKQLNMHLFPRASQGLNETVSSPWHSLSHFINTL